MSGRNPEMKAFRKYLVVSISAGILGFPFLGILNSLILLAGIFLVLLLWDRSHSAGAWAASFWFKSRMPRAEKIGAVILLSSFILPPFLGSYGQDVLISMCLYIILSIGLNIHVGLTGMLNLGYIAFYAVGAYSHALLSTRFAMPFWLDLFIGACMAGGFGFLLCLPTLRLRGDYLAIVTLAFGEMVRIILNNWDSLTGGPNGILGVKRPEISGIEFTSPIHFYYLILIMTILLVFVTRRLIASRVGRALMAIREDELAAEAMGINTSRMKLLAFSIGAAYAGAAGAFFAAKQGFVSPESFNFLESVLVLCMVVLGGMGTLFGPILGAAILVLLPEVLREFHLYRMLIFGLAVVAMMIFMPQGLLGTRKQ